MENNLKKIVLEKGMRHSYLAEKVGVSNTAFSYWINNHRQPSGIYIARLCKELGCVAEEIYNV
tara:strand:+ start:620 stop:808 length:189 start_codon:yes stop_codon:yes gene_type:complete